MRMEFGTLCLPLICVGVSLSVCVDEAQAQSDGDGFSAEVEVFGGQDAVPPDIVESGITQDRIEQLLGANADVTFRIGDTRFMADAGGEIYPVDERFNRYSLGAGVQQDIPLANGGRTRLRLGAGYEYVFGEEGRVFDRVRAQSQIIHRHGPSNTSIARLQFGHRNQSEDRFTGFDQDEWLLELRHTWRPNGGSGSISGSLLGLSHDATDDRFSYDGYGFRLIGSIPAGDDWMINGRLSAVRRDYKAPFSALYPENRSDTHWRVAIGAERPVGRMVSIFGEAGYLSNPSNIPVRDFDGFIAKIGLRLRPL